MNKSKKAEAMISKKDAKQQIFEAFKMEAMELAKKAGQAKAMGLGIDRYEEAFFSLKVVADSLIDEYYSKLLSDCFFKAIPLFEKHFTN